MPDIVSITCGSCGEGVAAGVVAGHPAAGNTAWLKCPKCSEGSVRLQDGSVYPTAPAGGSVANLPEDVAHAWREARTAHAVAAYTASEMMCRKILMHLAVDKAQASDDLRFGQYVDALVSGGFVTTQLKPAVDRVRSRGNIANHELPASTEEESRATLAITEYLLRGLYEIPLL